MQTYFFKTSISLISLIGFPFFKKKGKLCLKRSFKLRKTWFISRAYKLRKDLFCKNKLRLKRNFKLRKFGLNAKFIYLQSLSYFFIFVLFI